MQQFMQNLAQQDPGNDEGRPSSTPVGNAFAQEIRQAMSKLTGQQGFPLPYPVVLKHNDLAKLSKFDYKALVCRGELRMALCFLQVGDRKTVTVLVSENMMVVRVRMSKVPYGVFRGSVFSGYATPSSDGGADFVMSDCLYYRGRNMARRPFEERIESCLTCVEEASQDSVDSGFRLSLTPTWNVQSEDFWAMLQDDDSWTSVLFVPATLAIKTGAVQSTLFEHSAVDFADVRDALTDSIARPDILDDCQGAPVEVQVTTNANEKIPLVEVAVVTEPATVPVAEPSRTYSEALQKPGNGVGEAEKPDLKEESGLPSPVRWQQLREWMLANMMGR